MVGCISILCMSNHLDGGSASRTLQSHVHPIQPQHVQEYIEQGRADLTRVAAHPDGGEGQHTDQVVDARLEVLNLIYRFVHLTGPAERSMAKRLSCNCAKNSSGGTKNGFSCRTPPMITNELVRMISTTTSPRNLVRSYVQITGFTGPFLSSQTSFALASYSRSSFRSRSASKAHSISVTKRIKGKPFALASLATSSNKAMSCAGRSTLRSDGCSSSLAVPTGCSLVRPPHRFRQMPVAACALDVAGINGVNRFLAAFQA